MKKYKVVATYISYCTLEIDADDEDDAWRIAKEADGGDFTPSNQYFDWNINQISEVTQ